MHPNTVQTLVIRDLHCRSRSFAIGSSCCRSLVVPKKRLESISGGKLEGGRPQEWVGYFCGHPITTARFASKSSHWEPLLTSILVEMMPTCARLATIRTGWPKFGSGILRGKGICVRKAPSY